MHALSRVQEGREVSERVVIQKFAFESLRAVNGLSSLDGMVGGIFPFFDRFFDRIGFRDHRVAEQDARRPRGAG